MYIVMVLPAVLSAAIPAVAGLFGQERANRQNLAEADRNRRFQSEQAGRQMAFQERMRNTEWQAAVADMEAAGINPAVAYSQGGASAPGGSAGAGAQGTVGDSVSSAMGMLLQSAQLKKLRAETHTAEYEAMRKGAEVTQLLGDKGADSLLSRLLYADLREKLQRTRLTGAQADTQTPKGDLFKALGDDVLPILLRFINSAGAASQRLLRGN